MKKDDWIRLWLHVPWGMLGGVIFLFNQSYGLMSVTLMVTYEGFNDWRKKDASYKDVLGICWGWLIVGILNILIPIIYRFLIVQGGIMV